MLQAALPTNQGWHPTENLSAIPGQVLLALGSCTGTAGGDAEKEASQSKATPWELGAYYQSSLGNSPRQAAHCMCAVHHQNLPELGPRRVPGHRNLSARKRESVMGREKW